MSNIGKVLEESGLLERTENEKAVMGALGKEVEKDINAEELYDKSMEKSRENNSKFGIYIWVFYGIYAFFTGKFGGLLSLVLFIIPGIFLASFASMIPNYAQELLARTYTKIKAGNSLTILTSYFLFIIHIIFIVVVASNFINFLNKL